MAASVCTDIFTVCIVIDVNCTLSILSGNVLQKVSGDGSHTITVPFTYTIGTDPDTTHTNFGFSIAPSAGSYPAGITVTNVTFAPAIPDVSGDPLAVKNATVTVTFTVAATITMNITFDIIVQLNTGV